MLVEPLRLAAGVMVATQTSKVRRKETLLEVVEVRAEASMLMVIPLSTAEAVEQAEGRAQDMRVAVRYLAQAEGLAGTM